MSWLYTFTIYPLELIYKSIYMLCVGFSGSYGIGLITLSVCTFFAISPLKRAVSGIVAREHDIQSVLAPQLKKIREESRGAERHARTQRLFRRYGYHPVMAVRSAMGVVLQIPFLMAAYYMVEGLETLHGQSFLFLHDLSQPDALLGGVNLLPLVMTTVNLATIFTSADMHKMDKIQAIAVAILFLVLLYGAPSALLFYWTLNNILYLLMNVRVFAAAVTTLENAFGKIFTTKVLFSPVLTLPLALLAGPFFMWSQNWHMYTWGELGLSVALLTGCALLLGAMGWVITAVHAYHKSRIGGFIPLILKSRTYTAFVALILGVLIVQGICAIFSAQFHNLIQAWQMRLFFKMESMAVLSVILYAGMRFVASTPDVSFLAAMALKSQVGNALMALALGTLVVEGVCAVFAVEFHKIVRIWQMRLFIKLESVAILTGILFAGMHYMSSDSMRERRMHPVMDFFLSIGVVEILCFFLNFPITTAINTTFGLITFHICAITMCWMIVLRFGPWIINSFLLIYLCVSIITAITDIVNYEINNDIGLEKQVKSYTMLEKKPNIYLFYMESTQGFDSLKNIFHMDTNPFQEFLQNNGFRIYPNTFSDGQATAFTMCVVATMQHWDVALRGLDDVWPKVRSIVAGDEDNVLYATMKANGYHTVHLTMANPYLFTKPKGNLDESDVYMPDYQMRPILELNPAFQRLQRSATPKFTGTLAERVHQVMMESLGRKQPLLLLFKGGTEHTDPHGKYTFRQRFEWVASGVYQRHLEQGFEEAESIISDILKHDPHSVIILMGDHGPHRFRSIASVGIPFGDRSALARAMAAEGESLRSYATDIFDVLLAIHMPEGPQDISYGYPISSVNLFRHVFAGINQDPSVLNKRVPQQSKDYGIILVKEGIVQEFEDVASEERADDNGQTGE